MGELRAASDVARECFATVLLSDGGADYIDRPEAVTADRLAIVAWLREWIETEGNQHQTPSGSVSPIELVDALEAAIRRAAEEGEGT